MQSKFHSPLIGVIGMLSSASPVRAVTNACFHAAQAATVVTTNMTATMIRSGAYEFAYSLDGW